MESSLRAQRSNLPCFQVKAGLKGVLALIIGLRVTMSFRMMATMMSLCGLPLALSLSQGDEGRVVRAG